MSNNIPSNKVAKNYFPSDVLKWIKINSISKPKLTLKLMQICKYFQHPKFPYFVVRYLFYETNYWNFTALNGPKRVDFESVIKNQTKIWLTGCLKFFSYPGCIISKIVFCDVINLKLGNMVISYDEFKLFTAAGHVEELYLRNIEINFENGDPLFIADIFKCVPKVKEIRLNMDNFRSKTFSLDSLKTFQDIDTTNLEKISLINSSYQQFEIFSKFMEQHPHIQYRIEFQTYLSTENVTTLKNYVQNIINAGLTPYPPPYITYPGQLDNVQYWDLSYLIKEYEELMSEIMEE